MASPTIAVVAGALANKVGNGGEAWVRPTWTLGLTRLGFDGWFVEQLAPGSTDDARDRAVRWFREVTDWFGIGGRSVLVQGTSTLVGPPFDSVRHLIEEAALLVDISGHLDHPGLATPRAVRVYLDVDPGFTQIWAEHGWSSSADTTITSPSAAPSARRRAHSRRAGSTGSPRCRRADRPLVRRTDASGPARFTRSARGGLRTDRSRGRGSTTG